MSRTTKPKAKASTSETPRRTDMILAMNDPYMQQIINSTKTYEFRKYNMAGIERVWFYCTILHSAITHIYPINTAIIRNPSNAPLPKDGLKNKDYNKKHPDYKGYNYTYRIKSVYKINAQGGKGITWAIIRDEYSMKIAPQGRVMVPQSMLDQY
ncbi:hypothetical protein B0T10DRAFT_569051 [Thelonectria olida]|uniref:Uncharacterized protein n=1 Tax=Thelonectria olida TaxID=1576542 RepID=A0A9P8VRU3_9HYPO|nr:hypothetical protein B0T10DRAFT_569051 [Thelonectria olida]